MAMCSIQRQRPRRWERVAMCSIPLRKPPWMLDDDDDVLLVVDVDCDDEDNVVDDPIGSGRASSASVAPRGGWGHA